ncbi:propionate kinase [Klebsiella pneumoniae]|uniref:Propionate kinase n=1 Tax=Klebsiella pneumoniae TaxID=573 RepID=A0A377TYA1_KLEPN|nr:propionate kinase [Klebsiella pneumoniae]
MRAMPAPAWRLKPLSIVSPAILPVTPRRCSVSTALFSPAGLAENSVLIRRLVSERLAVFGLAMDAARNQQPIRPASA